MRIKPLEEYRIGLRQSSGIVIENVDVISAFPSPTTILGIIGAMKNAKPSQLSGIDDLREAYTSLTGNNTLSGDCDSSDNPLIWGPLIKEKDNKIYTPLFFNKLILDPIEYVKTSLNENVKVQSESLVKEIGIQIRRMNQMNRGSRNTIHLFYQKFFGSNYELEYCINIDDLKKLVKENVVALGGENRYARVRIDNGNCNFGNGNYAILLQPLLFESDSEYFVRLDNVKGLGCIDEIYGVLVEKGNKIDFNNFKVKVVYYALGYGNERRPMLQALPPGTVIKVKETCNNAKALGLLSELGFGAIYRVDPGNR
ncbi:type III-B CRISPR module-associated protein Cmr3 [Saccharolobus solfataricus]|nr:type III-B CRISPR module-associated protein Cmr3 [Saccharolobus solfataricus]